MPEISVIVPVYRVEEYLDRCLESLTVQTFEDFEAILVDDGSPDNCPRLCEEWAAKDRRFRVVHKENGGLSSARNAGMEIAGGRYVAFLDSDDWMEPDMLAYLRNLLIGHPEAQIAQCEAVMSRDESPVAEQPSERLRVLTRKEMLDYFFRIHGEASNDSVWNKLYRRELLTGFRFVETLNEDVEASYEFYTRADRMVMSNRRLYHYFVNPAGITRSRFRRQDLEYLAVWDRVQARTEKELPEYAPYARMGRKRANFTLLAKMTLKGFDRSDGELRAVKKELKRQVRRDFRDLMGWKMPLSRKILLVLVCI